jgi:hypothetical protein
MTGFSNRSTLHRRLSTFCDWIATESAREDVIRKQADEIRIRIRSKAVADGLTVRSTPNSGSFAKRTGLRRHLRGVSDVEGQDVDLPFVVSPKTGEDANVDRLLDGFERYAKESYPDTPRERFKCSIKLRFVSSKLAYDLVPMLATDKDDEQILMRSDGDHRRTSVQKNVAFITRRTHASNELRGRVKFNECIRLIKWWREFRVQEADSLKEVPSFLVELLAAKAYDDAHGVSETYADTLGRWFAYLADIVENRRPVVFTDYVRAPAIPEGVWTVLDPVNPDNNVVAKWPGYHVDELADWFSRGRDLWARAIRADLQGRDAVSLEALVELFGAPLRHHCGDQ